MQMDTTSSVKEVSEGFIGISNCDLTITEQNLVLYIKGKDITQGGGTGKYQHMINKDITQICGTGKYQHLTSVIMSYKDPTTQVNRVSEIIQTLIKAEAPSPPFWKYALCDAIDFQRVATHLVEEIKAELGKY